MYCCRKHGLWMRIKLRLLCFVGRSRCGWPGKHECPGCF